MANPFGASSIAAGYATSRPPLHPLILERVKRAVPRLVKVGRALDVGCGAGLSTGALEGMAEQRVGMEPAESMLRWVESTAPGATFLVGKAESIPVRSGCIELITAAGALNYVDLPKFFDEADRILVPGGALVVYDFSPGQVGDWFSNFIERYPWPPNEATYLNPELLSQADPRFRMESSENFEIGIPLSREFYLDYVMTETNVAFAVRSGIAEASIREWCFSTLASVWGRSSRDVLFSGYFACLIK